MMRSIPLVLLCGLGGGACHAAWQQPPTPAAGPLRPAPEAPKVGENGAVARARGVYLEAELHAWPGDGAAQGYVTPVRVRIVNEGDRPIRIHKESFTILGPGGRAFVPVEPREAGREWRGGPEKSPGQILFPPFREDGWGLNPIYSEIHPYLETNRYRLGWSLDANRLYYPDIRGPRPTKRMYSLELPGGVVAPGDSVEGFLYFQKVEKKPGTYLLRFHIEDARSGRVLGSLKIPLERRG